MNANRVQTLGIFFNAVGIFLYPNENFNAKSLQCNAKHVQFLQGGRNARKSNITRGEEKESRLIDLKSNYLKLIHLN